MEGFNWRVGVRIVHYVYEHTKRWCFATVTGIVGSMARPPEHLNKVAGVGKVLVELRGHIHLWTADPATFSGQSARPVSVSLPS